HRAWLGHRSQHCSRPRGRLSSVRQRARANLFRAHPSTIRRRKSDTESLDMGRILLVDDEPNMRRILASNLRLDHHQAWEAGGVEEARRILVANDFDVVITDQKMPDGEGLTVLAAAQEIDPTLPVILLTA